MKVLLLAVLAFPGAAIAQTVVVHPNQYATTTGVTDNAFPFNYSSGAGRYQQTYDATQFPGPLTIDRIGFRYQTTAARSMDTVDIRVSASTCMTPWNAPSSTFASNTGADVLVVFDGMATIPPIAAGQPNPQPFVFFITFTSSFNYDPAAGDLLLDFEVRQSANATNAGSFSRADANTGVYRIYDSSTSTATTGTVSTVGLITEFVGNSCSGSVMRLGAGCADSSGTTMQMVTDGCPDLGATFTIRTQTGASVTGPIVLRLGASDQFWGPLMLPVDLGLLGAPGCSVYTSDEVQIGPLSNPGGGVDLTVTMPMTLPVTGTPFFAQSLMLDPANALNIVSSNYIAIVVGP